MDSTKIVIVGNGFDLYHGLKTSFWDFIKSSEISKETLQGLCLMTDLNSSYYEQGFVPFASWSNLEKLYWYASGSLDGEDVNVEHFNSVIEGFKKEFKCYLENLDYDDIKASDPVQKELSKADIILDFNYTDTIAKLYQADLKENCKYIKIHGSVQDNNIVLGFANMLSDDGYGVSDLIKKLFPPSGNLMYKSTIHCETPDKWYGEKLWLRILSQFKKEYETTNSDEKELYDWYHKYARAKYQGNHAKSNCRIPNGYQYIFVGENMPKGDVQKVKPTSARVNDFLECHNYLPGMIDLGEIWKKKVEITVMGHSMECDLDVFFQLYLLVKEKGISRTAVFLRHADDDRKILDENDKLKKKIAEIFEYVNIEERYYE